ncbi:hypothetical protein GQX74_003986 [Glossina fuscipes]|nr:hypothetical protein GQX74_003986 [Glossina fuscipes]
MANVVSLRQFCLRTNHLLTLNDKHMPMIFILLWILSGKLLEVFVRISSSYVDVRIIVRAHFQTCLSHQQSSTQEFAQVLWERGAIILHIRAFDASKHKYSRDSKFNY